MEKSKISPFLTAQWKNLRRGKNGRFRSGRFRDAAMHHLGLNDSSYFYTIINGRIEISTVDIQVLMDLMRNTQKIK